MTDTNLAGLPGYEAPVLAEYVTVRGEPRTVRYQIVSHSIDPEGEPIQVPRNLAGCTVSAHLASGGPNGPVVIRWDSVTTPDTCRITDEDLGLIELTSPAAETAGWCFEKAVGELWITTPGGEPARCYVITTHVMEARPSWLI